MQIDITQQISTTIDGAVSIVLKTKDGIIHIDGEISEGCFIIDDMDIEDIPLPEFKARLTRRRRGLVLDEQEEAFEANMPAILLERSIAR